MSRELIEPVGFGFFEEKSKTHRSGRGCRAPKDGTVVFTSSVVVFAVPSHGGQREG